MIPLPLVLCLSAKLLLVHFELYLHYWLNVEPLPSLLCFLITLMVTSITAKLPLSTYMFYAVGTSSYEWLGSICIKDPCYVSLNTCS